MSDEHPLLGYFERAAVGRFPDPHGGVTMLPALPSGRNAVVAFTGHAVIATDLDATDLADLVVDGFGQAQSPTVLLRLARGSTIDIIDATLVGRGQGGGTLPVTSAFDDHPRVVYARTLRDDVMVHGDERGLITISSGLAGRREMSIELLDAAHGRGAGRSLIIEALALVPDGELLFAAVSPGNARSLRAFLAVGFVPLCSEVNITPPGAGRP